MSKLAKVLKEDHGLETLVLSIDDFYLTHSEQLSLAKSQPENKLVQHRGEPGTHDLPLALSTLSSLRSNQPTPIPSYNKSAFSGAGDRVPVSEWKTVTTPTIVILEGWCVGYTSLPSSEIQAQYQQSLPPQSNPSNSTLPNHQLPHLLFINTQLSAYNRVWEFFDTFIMLDAKDPRLAYKWREEQEEWLRKEGKGAMSPEDVRKFVDGYYPAYELYLPGLRKGRVLEVMGEYHGKRDRKVNMWKIRIDGERKALGLEKWQWYLGEVFEMVIMD